LKWLIEHDFGKKKKKRQKMKASNKTIIFFFNSEHTERGRVIIFVDLSSLDCPNESDQFHFGSMIEKGLEVIFFSPFFKTGYQVNWYTKINRINKQTNKQKKMCY
jgi:hypothetical protein